MDKINTEEILQICASYAYVCGLIYGEISKAMEKNTVDDLEQFLIAQLEEMNRITNDFMAILHLNFLPEEIKNDKKEDDRI